MTDSLYTPDELIDAVWEDYISRYPAQDTKYTADDVDENLYAMADLYVRNYDGDFAFLVDVKAKMDEGNTLSAGAAKGVLNCMTAAYRRRGGGGGGIPLTTLPNVGYYAVPVQEYVELLRVSPWTPKNSTDELLMISATNVPDSLYAFGMAGVIDPAAKTYRILNKIDDAIQREAITNLVMAEPEKRQLWSEQFETMTGKHHLTGRVTNKSVYDAFVATGQSPF